MANLQSEWEAASPDLQAAWDAASPQPSSTTTNDPFFHVTLPPSPSTLGRVGQVVKEGILPTVGQLGGAVAGGVLASPTVAGVPLGVLAGEASGSALGEAANQLTGIKYRSLVDPGLNWTDIGISGLAPGVGRGLYAGGKHLLNQGSRMIPGAGVALQEYGAKAATQAVDWLKRRVGNVDQLYDIVSQHNPVIDTTHTQQALMKLLQEYSANVPTIMEGEAPVQSVKKLASGLLQEMQGASSPALGYHQPALSFQKLRNAMKLMNENYGTSSGTLQHAYGVIRNAIKQDFENAATRPLNQTAPAAVSALNRANLAYRKQLAADQLESVLQKAISERTNDQLTTFNRRKLMDALEHNEDITKNLAPMELAALKMRLKQLGLIPALPAPPGQHVGSARTVLAGGLGGLAGGAFGHSPTAVAEGFAAGPLAMELMEKLATTEWGKKLILKWAYAKGPRYGAQTAAALAAGVSPSLPRAFSNQP